MLHELSARHAVDNFSGSSFSDTNNYGAAINSTVYQRAVLDASDQMIGLQDPLTTTGVIAVGFAGVEIDILSLTRDTWI